VSNQLNRKECAYRYRCVGFKKPQVPVNELRLVDQLMVGVVFKCVVVVSVLLWEENLKDGLSLR